MSFVSRGIFVSSGGEWDVARGWRVRDAVSRARFSAYPGEWPSLSLGSVHVPRILDSHVFMPDRPRGSNL